MNHEKRAYAIRPYVFLLVLLFLAACSGKPDTGPEKVRWDGDTCVRCAMAVSDRHYAAQIRGGVPVQKTKVYKFDDIGCAVIWLDEQPWKDNPAVEIWVTDFRSGDWIDARKAWYMPDKITPMAYGLGAQPEQQQGALDFTQAKAHVYKVEEKYNIHGGAAHPPPTEEPAR